LHLKEAEAEEVNWLDAVLVFILAGGVYRGLKTGFVLSCIRLTGIAAAFLAAARYHRAVGDLIEQRWHLADILATWMANIFKLPAAVTHVNNDSPLLNTPLFLLNTPLFQGSAALFGVEAIHPVAGAGTDPWYGLACAIVNVGAFILLFVAVERLWFFIGSHLTFFRKWLFFRPLDKTGGILLGTAYGVIGGAVLVLLLFYAADFLSYFRGHGNFLTQALQTAVLVPYYEGLLRVAIGFLPGISLGTGKG